MSRLQTRGSGNPIAPLASLALALSLGSLPGTGRLMGQVALFAELPFVGLDSGGRQVLLVDAGPDAVFQRYVVAGSASGVAPGFLLGGLRVPLVADAYFQWTLTNPEAVLRGASGLLDADGRARVVFEIPAGTDPNLEGRRLHHAVVVLDSAGRPRGVSDAVSLDFIRPDFRAEAPDEGRVLGLGSAAIEGFLAASAAALPGAEVRVAGVPALLTPLASGEGARFRAEGVPLRVGTNQLAVELRAAGRPSVVQTLPVTAARLSSNTVATSGELAYLARGRSGLAVLNAERGGFDPVPLPTPMASVDDVALADGLLFALDASGAGFLAVYDLSDARAPRLVSGPIAVGVSPFAGVSAGGGRVVVSGGTGRLTVRGYDRATGALGSSVASIDLGVGQPDVLVSRDGTRAFVSTDFSGTVGGAGFGVSILELRSPPALPIVRARVGLPGAGFSAGLQGPANFPVVAAELPGGQVLFAHGGGLTRLEAPSGRVLEVLPLGALNSLTVEGSMAYAATSSGTLQVVDYAGGGAQLIATRSLGANGVTGIAVAGAQLVIAANAGGTLLLPR